jgi:tetratricopeptide (TPR) repeat protein
MPWRTVTRPFESFAKMFNAHVLLEETIQIVERRLKEKNSADPMTDLAFLISEYTRRGELHKANMASTYMLRLAEGESQTQFEVTPLDVELLTDRKKYLRSQFRFNKKAAGVVLAIEVILLGMISFCQANPEWEIGARIALCPWDSNAFLDRAATSRKSRDWKSALADCEHALSVSPGNQRAYRLMSLIAYDSGDFDVALSCVERADLADRRNIRLKSEILFFKGNYRDAALYPFQAWSSSKPPLNATDALDAAYAFANSGDYEAALAAAEKAQTIAPNNEDLSAAHSQKARYLLRLQRYGEAETETTAAIALDAKGKPQLARWDAYLYRGEARLANHDSAGALADANNSIALKQFSGRQLRLRANAFKMLGQPDKASYDFRSAELYKCAGSDI